MGIPAGRVTEKLDEYLDSKDFEAAEHHLKYWLEEARFNRDLRGELTVINELIGLYRKIEKEAPAIECCKRAIELCGPNPTSVSAGTTLLNAATAYKAFGKAAEAVPLYEKAREIYEAGLKSDDLRLAGLYNNMALALAETENYAGANELFSKALDITLAAPGSEAEAAITLCNLADLKAAEFGTEKAEKYIFDCLTRAEKLLDSDCGENEGYRAFVCEKCAPTFGYYGFFAAEQKLSKRAKDYYERT